MARRIIVRHSSGEQCKLFTAYAANLAQCCILTARLHCEHCAITIALDVHPNVQRKQGDWVDGRYRIEAELPGGCMGNVYSARDVHLDRRVALKFSPAHCDALLMEAKQLAKIESFHVVAALAFGVDHGDDFLVMEWIEGPTLAALVRAMDYRLPLRQVAELLADVALGLTALHDKGIVHGDLKLENVVLQTRSERAMLIDLGLSSRPQREGQIAGTPQYMAPELFWRGDPCTVATDLYALGCVGYELTTGVPPYDGSFAEEIMELHRDAPIPTVSTFRREAAIWDEVFARALAKAPSERFASVAEFSAALESTNISM